ncbi:MAG: 16S rRNA (adenine(1518)-N(6)/adenine(1519)-N(6))-dimethyltransferase RsmA [Bacteroidetes bacterium]|nr:16S rRNA (adenine(1518)-N(6)/adenine(1519)-N(6))-dimethyltransferase RsmA [Bacteroidota bacterium]
MKHQVTAKKHLGQHFLNDENIAKNIVNALLEKDKATPIIEIGAGTGVLTQFLINDVEKFFALDVDEESVAFLKNKYPDKAEKILFSDFLETDLEKLAGNKFNVIGNFPYNISSQIMFKVLEHKENVNVVVGMFQKEVAQRLAEKPGTKTYGILSVLLQAFYDIEYLFTVNENVFTPPPKVKSAVIRLSRNGVKKLDCDEILFKQVVKTAFNQRRKTIRNSIRSLFNNNEIRFPLLDKRPEQLSVAQFVELTQFVDGNSKN